jgi:hypothetical protein
MPAALVPVTGCRVCSVPYRRELEALLAGGSARISDGHLGPAATSRPVAPRQVGGRHAATSIDSITLSYGSGRGTLRWEGRLLSGHEVSRAGDPERPADRLQADTGAAAVMRQVRTVRSDSPV